MRGGMLRALATLVGLLPLLIMNGCPNPDGDCGGFGCGDDDDDDDGSFECPGIWWGFSSTPDEWSIVAVFASGGEDFAIGPRTMSQYEFVPGLWDDESKRIDNEERPGGCFQDMGGMFLGDGDIYDRSLYSVAFSMQSEGSWPGGSIQVVPTDGSDPYPLGDPNSVRGTAIEPDLEGGFVVCGSLVADVDNSVIWVDSDGSILAKDDMPSGSCYDLILAADGTYYVTDPTAGKVYNYDLEFGDFAEVGELPNGGGLGTEDWVIGEAGDGTLFIGDDAQIHTMDPDSGGTESYTMFTTTGTNGAHTLRLNWSNQLGAMTASSVLKDLPNSAYYGPHTGAITRMQGATVHPDVVWTYGIASAEIPLDYEIVDLQDWIDNPQ